MNQHDRGLSDQRLAVLNKLMERRGHIQSALDRQEGEGFTFDHVFDMVTQQRALFFWNDSSSAVIEIRNYPGETVLHVFLGAGTTEGLLALYDFVANWGKDAVGATKMTTLCRKGFRRKLEKFGWYEPQAWLVKDI
jgi:hypothetical protein